MKLPAWARADHPVARREVAVWKQIGKRWGWLVLLLALLPCACSGLCSLSALPTALTAETPAAALILFLAWSVTVGIWLTSGLWSWVISTFAGIGSAIMIARERETLNWSLLRLTTLSIREVLAAKLAALGRLLCWPVVAVLALQSLGISLLAVIAFVGVVALNRSSPDSLPTDQMVQLCLIILGVWPVALIYLAVAQIINVLYSSAVGLVTSAFSRTSGSAVALTFVVNFGLTFFLFVPLQQFITLGLQLLGGVVSLLTQSPAALLILTPLASFILPILIQIGLTIAALVIAVRKSETINE